MKNLYLAIRTIFITGFLINSSPLFSQVDLLKYVEQNAIPLLNRQNTLNVNFKWDMDGKSQAQLNEGLNNLDEGNWQLALGSFESFLNVNFQLWVGHYYRGQALM